MCGFVVFVKWRKTYGRTVNRPTPRKSHRCWNCPFERPGRSSVCRSSCKRKQQGTAEHGRAVKKVRAAFACSSMHSWEENFALRKWAHLLVQAENGSTKQENSPDFNIRCVLSCAKTFSVREHSTVFIQLWTHVQNCRDFDWQLKLASCCLWVLLAAPRLKAERKMCITTTAVVIVVVFAVEHCYRWSTCGAPPHHSLSTASRPRRW